MMERETMIVMVDTLSILYYEKMVGYAPSKLCGFDNIRDLYALDEHFSPIYESYGQKAQDGFYLTEGYLLPIIMSLSPNYPN